jgi:hypothetical protein
VRVLGLSAKIGGGKDAVAARLVERWGYRIVRFSDALKDEVLERLPRTLEALHEMSGHTHELSSCSYAARPECIRDMVRNRKPHGVRELLQEWGTELRRAEDGDYWTRKWKASATGLVVAPDVRFQNEAEAVAEAGGLLWRIVRPGTVQGDHESETALDGWRWWDAVIHNDGTLQDLWAKVDALMEERGAKVA